MGNQNTLIYKDKTIFMGLHQEEVAL